MTKKEERKTYKIGDGPDTDRKLEVGGSADAGHKTEVGGSASASHKLEVGGSASAHHKHEVKDATLSLNNIRSRASRANIISQEVTTSKVQRRIMLIFDRYIDR